MNIRVDLQRAIFDGMEIVFRSPVDCSQVTGLIVYYKERGYTVSKEFAFADAHGNNVGDIDHLFAENVVVKVILDVATGMAFVQNADTNAYIERTFIKTVNGVEPDENGNVKIDGGIGEEEVVVEVVGSEDFSITGFARPAPKNGELFGTTYIYSRTDYIDVSQYESVTVHCKPRSESVSPCVWFDANKNYISGEVASTLDESDFTYEVPSGAVYAVFSSENDVANEIKVVGTKVLDFDAKVKDCLVHSDVDGTGDTDFNFIVEKNSTVKKVRAKQVLNMETNEVVAVDADYNIVGFCRPAPKSGELFGDTNVYSRTDYIDISAYNTITVHCRARTDSVSPCVWFDADKTYISGETASNLEEADFTYEVPKGAVYAIFSSSISTTEDRVAIGIKSVPLSEAVAEMKEQMGKVATAQYKCYISPVGSDDNDGLTFASPVKTLDRARQLLSEDGELIFMQGEYHNLNYNLSLFSKVSTIGNVWLVYYSDRFTKATLVDGYTRVYSAPYTGSYSNYLWQFDIPDANTAISAEERHPLQRNRSFRLEHTRIYPVTKFDTTSTDLAGFLSTMEATTDKYMYYMDGTNCYFTSPDDDLATSPIIIPSNTMLKASTERKVNISGLKIYFASILTTKLSGVLDNLTVGYNAAQGAIMWDNTFGLILNNCEAVASTNDGINGHTDGDIACYNCWGHDCSDDGESDHEKCHIVQYGGLYEYNGNGCTPASGASGEYISTICRNNNAWDWVSDPAGTGFSAQSTSTTDGASMYCIGCYTSGCKIGFRQKSSSKATFINCVSKNDDTAFGSGTQINCESFDDEHPQYNTEEWVFELADGSTVTKQVMVK